MKRKMVALAALPLLVLFGAMPQYAGSAWKGVINMQITSPAFEEGGPIPAKYTCDGQDISPPLAWKNAPDGTKSFALISDDPDAPMSTWVHWVAFNIPPELTGLQENVRKEAEAKNGVRQGNNSWPRMGYGGPCPPSGTHRYYFKIYALNALLDLKPGATKAEVLQAMKGHVLAEAHLMGKYKRRR